MSTTQDEVYISVDIETDGPIPGPNSMLSLGAAAFKLAKLDEQGPQLVAQRIGEWSANLALLPGASGAPSTMKWWSEQPEAWAATRTNLREPGEATRTFAEWVTKLPGKPVFVAYPVGFDFTFVYWYLINFTGSSPFSHSALDMKTLAMSLLKAPYRESTKRNFRATWRSLSRRHTHIAIDDAIEQGEIFCAMMAELLSLPLVFRM